MNDAVGLAAERESSRLCGACGMCCDGTIFSSVPLRNLEESNVMHRRQIPVRVVDESSQFDQPCPAHTEAGCSMYADRPRACRRYRCDLLKSLEAGETSFEDAKSTALATSERSREVRALLVEQVHDDGLSLPLLYNRFELANRDTFDSVEFRRTHAQLLLRFAHYRSEIAKNFHAPTSQPEGPERLV